MNGNEISSSNEFVRLVKAHRYRNDQFILFILSLIHRSMDMATIRRHADEKETCGARMELIIEKEISDLHSTSC